MPVTVIILAAQRPGGTNPLAARAGVSHKCLVPICDRPLIEHVLDTITGLPAIKEIRISLEEEAHETVGEIANQFADRGVPVSFCKNDSNILESVLKATNGDEGPFIVTTADNVLTTPEGFEKVREALGQSDAVIAFASRENVWAAHPEGQRNFYEFRDAGYANCNVYGIANRKAFKAAESFREGGKFQKNPLRLLRAIGIYPIIVFKLKLLPLQECFSRLGKRWNLNMQAIIYEDGSLAIDVDNERTYACAEAILKQRAAKS